MKKISRFATVLIFAASFGTPSVVSAACPIGYTPDLQNSANCIPNSQTYGIGSQTVPNTVSQPSSGSINSTYLRFYYDLILTVVNSYLVPVLIAIAFIVFLWGVYKYFIWGAENEHEKAEGRKFAMWGIIGFVIITSVWGIVNIVKETIVPSTAGSNRPNYPTL